MKINFLKIPAHRVFNYKSRYYDANKEELNERVRKIEENMKQNNNEEYVFKRENINFRKSYSVERKRTEAKLPNKRLFVYVAILLFVIAIFVSIRNFSYLIDPENYNKKKQTENTDINKDYDDWNPETQIIIVDEDVEIIENTND
jgi:hypothetical protein